MKKILAAVDFSDLATQVVDQAALLAKAFGSEILIVHISPPPATFIGNEMSPPVIAEQHIEEVERVHGDLKSMVGFLEGKGIAASYEYLQGPIIETLVGKSVEWNADLVVMGAHSHGFVYRAFIGSISSGVLKLSKCPVLILPEK
ncbi:MAG: universal stress protein [Bacteroidales bacterium]|nr:universal stress protein [Bacteroidales bacterium]